MQPAIENLHFSQCYSNNPAYFEWSFCLYRIKLNKDPCSFLGIKKNAFTWQNLQFWRHQLDGRATVCNCRKWPEKRGAPSGIATSECGILRCHFCSNCFLETLETRLSSLRPPHLEKKSSMIKFTLNSTDSSKGLENFSNIIQSAR